MMIRHLAILLKNISHFLQHSLYNYYNHRNAYVSTVVLKPDLSSKLPEVLNKKKKKKVLGLTQYRFVVFRGRWRSWISSSSFTVQMKFMQPVIGRTEIRFHVFPFSGQCPGRYSVLPEVGIGVSWAVIPYEMKGLVPALISSFRHSCFWPALPFRSVLSPDFFQPWHLMSGF